MRDRGGAGAQPDTLRGAESPDAGRCGPGSRQATAVARPASVRGGPAEAGQALTSTRPSARVAVFEAAATAFAGLSSLS